MKIQIPTDIPETDSQERRPTEGTISGPPEHPQSQIEAIPTKALASLSALEGKGQSGSAVVASSAMAAGRGASEVWMRNG